MTEKHWKLVERKIAAYLGGKRIPITGRQRGDVPDIDHPWLSPEIKSRTSFPNSWRDAMDQAHAASKPGQLPIVVWHEKGKGYGEALVQLRLCDFREWFVGEGHG